MDTRKTFLNHSRWNLKYFTNTIKPPPVTIWWLHLLLFSVIISKNTVENSTIQLDCEEGWTLINSSQNCYKYFDVRLPWQEARVTCISYSAVLAEPIGYEVNNELGKLLKNNSSFDKDSWIGYNYLNDQANESSLDIGYWSDQSPESITVALWDINEPTLTSGKCACMKEASTNQWKWKLFPCENTKSFLCQKTACLQGSFSCSLSGKESACINQTKVCDGIPDCPNGADENDCPKRNHFLIRKDSGEINASTINDETNKNNQTFHYQWIIEGRIGSRLQLTLSSTEALNDYSKLEVWLSGRTLQDSYRYNTYREALSRPESIVSNNNLAIIRWLTYRRNIQKGLNITWSSEPICYWKHVFNRSEANVVPLGKIDLRQDNNINDCLDACNSSCFIVTIDKVERKCYFYELVPLILSSSCCESYVKICPTQPRYSNELTATETFQTFHSTTYPTEYSENIHHIWILKAPLREIITLQFMDINIDSEASITVYDGDSSASKTLIKLSSGGAPITLFSTGNALAVYFQTGPKAVLRRGFLAKYKSGCDLTIKSDFGQIQSPGYPISVPYPPRLNCTWKIHSNTQPPAISLKFDKKFGLEKNKDFLKVYNGTTNKKFAQFNGEGFTGTSPPQTMHSLSGLFTLRFTTDSVNSDIGFRATFSSITYCGPVPNLINGYWENVSGFYSGHNATYTCLENYENTTDRTIFCTNQGKWKPLPVCIVKSCPPIFNISNGFWVKDGDSYRAVCDRNSQLVGYPLVICWKGIWVGRPECKKTPCDYLYLPRNAKEITPQNVTFYKGDRLNVTCKPGFQIKGDNPFLCGVQDTPTCQDIDECALNVSVCEQICVNTAPFYECECLAGFKKKNISSSKSKCIDVDECQSNNGGCSHNCTNLSGSYKCSCPFGWELFQTNAQLNTSLLPGDMGLHPGDYYRFNHTCIKINCKRPEIKNGYLLSDNNNFYFEDTVDVLCSEGYQLIGNTAVTCTATGNWSSLPFCESGTCPPVFSSSGIVSPSNTTEYGQVITINCTLTETPYIKHRRCVWDLQNKTFSTVGDFPECPEIDCGTPRRLPGSNPNQINCTTSGCSFNLSCLPSFNLTGTGYGPNNNTVKCDNDGRWKYHDLACKGPTCQDPGRPVDGEQLGDSYEEGSLIYFRCNRPGFEPSNRYPLQCVYNGSLNWNYTVPRCVDKEKPKFLNCSTETIFVNRMTTLNIPLPKAVDNSGEYIKVEVIPQKFRFTQLILTDMNITYRAMDSTQNTETCSFQIKMNDVEKPKVFCPNITSYVLFESVTLTKENFTVNASDNSGHVSLSFEPERLEIGYTPNSVYVIKVTAKDPSNNTEFCYIQVKTKDVPKTQCDRRRLLIPNSIITCDQNSVDISCNVSCAPGNLFYDTPAIITRVLTCNTSEGWQTEGIFCVPEQKTAFLMEFLYTYATNNETCVKEGLSIEIPKYFNKTNKYLTNSLLNPVKIGNPNIGNFKTISTKVSGNEVTAILGFELSSPNPSVKLLQAASKNMLACPSNIKCGNFRLPNCGKVIKVNVSRFGYICESAAKNSIINDRSICVSCPPGMYGKDFNQCLLCPKDTYNSEVNKTVCTTCPQGTNVNKNGSTNINSCYSKCLPGFYSSNGLMPCSPCPEQTFSYNTTFCQPCPPGKKTAGTGASSTSHCKMECQPGSYSQSGFEPCTLCPENTYMEFTGGKMCDPCDRNGYINKNGSSNSTDCKVTRICDKSVCQNGAICIGFLDDYYCDCPIGYKGKNCSEVIDPCLSNPCFYNQTCTQIDNTNKYNCTCEKGFSGLKCENEENSCESNSTCLNDGVCKDLVGDYECLCPSWSGYTGKRCEIELKPCEPNKCQNNATCLTGGNIRHVCICLPGFTGEFCEKNIDDCILKPCQNGGKCIDGTNNYTCQCKNGFYGKFCELIKDPCENNTCGKNKICKSNFYNNTFHCVCVKDFIENPQNKNECIAENLCPQIRCKNNGTCQPNPKPFKCMCPDGFTGSLCQVEISSCQNSSSCQIGEECRRVGNASKCVCKTPLIQGIRCIEPIDYCKDNQCAKEGTENCINLPNNFKCNCSDGFSGQYCQNKPCDLRCVHGNCSKEGGNWTCKCHLGWKGENCTELINKCDSNPCQNKGTCFGNLNEFHCKCAAGFRNTTCNEVIDFCQYANHCVGNGSKCQNEATHSTCICAKGQGGIGCQNNSPCTPTTCQNGGTCEVKQDKTNCICPIGFGGADCKKILNPCDEVKGCSKAQCQKQGQQYFCKCEAGKIGQYCKQDVSYDLDLFFPRNKGFIQPTPMPMWSQLTQDFLTLSFWIKYYLPEEEGELTSLALYGTTQLDGNPQITELISLKQDILTVQFSEIETFKLADINNGRWHHVLVTWANFQISVYFDFKLLKSNQYGQNKTLPKYGVLIPAGTLDGFRQNVKPSRFTGRISRLVLISKIWTLEQLKNLKNNVTQVIQDVLIDFYRSLLGMANILLDYPSEISQDMCDINPNCTDINTNSFPVVDVCPKSEMKVSKRFVQLNWMQPKFRHNSTTISNYIPGKSYFSWGSHTVIYVALGKKNETSTVCVFQLFNRRFGCKDVIPTSYLTNAERNCQEANGSIICNPNCEKQGKLPAVPGPRVYSCGVAQMWGYQQTSYFRFPLCAEIKDAQKVNIKVEMMMQFPGSQPDSTVLCEETKKTFADILKTFNLCSGANCAACSSKSINTTRRKRSVSNQPIVVNLDNLNSISNGVTAKDLLLSQIIDKNKLNFQNWSSSVVPGSVTATLYCFTGQQLNGQTCVELVSVPGTFLNSSTKQIEACLKGTYQSEFNKTSCLSCPLGRTTMGLMAESREQCKVICRVGSYFSIKDDMCLPCEIGFYQNKNGTFLCEGCPNGKTTSAKESSSLDKCINPDKSAVVALGGLSGRDIAIIIVVTILAFLFLLLILIFCCRTKIKKVLPCLTKNKIANAPEQNERYGKGNVKMVSYNLTNIRERRMGVGNGQRLSPQRNDYPNNYPDNVSDVSSSLEGSTQAFLPFTKRQLIAGDCKKRKMTSLESNAWLSNGDSSLLRMHQQPRLGAESEVGSLLIKVKPKRPKNNVVKVHLSNFQRKEPKIMIDSDEDDAR